MPHCATSKIATKQPVTSQTETVTSETQAVTSEAQTEALNKAFHNLRDVINAPDTSIETIVEEYDKFAADYDKVCLETFPRGRCRMFVGGVANPL